MDQSSYDDFQSGDYKFEQSTIQLSLDVYFELEDVGSILIAYEYTEDLDKIKSIEKSTKENINPEYSFLNSTFLEGRGIEDKPSSLGEQYLIAGSASIPVKGNYMESQADMLPQEKTKKCRTGQGTQNSAEFGIGALVEAYSKRCRKIWNLKTPTGEDINQEGTFMGLQMSINSTK